MEDLLPHLIHQAVDAPPVDTLAAIGLSQRCGVAHRKLDVPQRPLKDGTRCLHDPEFVREYVGTKRFDLEWLHRFL